MYERGGTTPAARPSETEFEPIVDPNAERDTRVPGRTLGALRQAQGELSVPTPGEGLVEITGDVAAWLAAQRITTTGLLTVFCRHTSASLVIQENADPDVQRDLRSFFSRLVREDRSLYRHVLEGEDDMPAHIRSALTLVQVSIPVAGGRLLLGTWQGLYLFEHRAAPHRRQIILHLVGE